jgi:hypothetical protein
MKGYQRMKGDHHAADFADVSVCLAAHGSSFLSHASSGEACRSGKCLKSNSTHVPSKHNISCLQGCALLQALLHETVYSCTIKDF